MKSLITTPTTIVEHLSLGSPLFSAFSIILLHHHQPKKKPRKTHPLYLIPHPYLSTPKYTITIYKLNHIKITRNRVAKTMI
jgi:hypothetical protein